MKQYETFELVLSGEAPENSYAEVNLTASFTLNGETRNVKGFYAGNNRYIVRFLPEKPGLYHYFVRGAAVLDGEEFCEASKGPATLIRTHGTHFQTADGHWFYPFGTTVYALSHQRDQLVDKTFETMRTAPFNKVRMCVFPKHYDYNTNEPALYPFEKTPSGWNVHHPVAEYWERLEAHIQRLNSLSIQCDLIIFHPYDRWGFSRLDRDESLIYLDYLIRRFSAFPNIWWSLANEYDLMGYNREDWKLFESFLSENDPFHHLLSNHQMLKPWSWEDDSITHICTQTRDVNRVSLLIRQYQKPLMVDECCYEGNLPQNWGNISGFEMVNRFWKVFCQGGYCTHGETFLDPDDIIWWSKGGTLKGESAPRIRFLRNLAESLPGPVSYCAMDLFNGEIEETQKKLPDGEKGSFAYLLKHIEPEYARILLQQIREFTGCCGDLAVLKYYARTCPALGTLSLAQEGSYQIDVIDIWEMTRTTVMTDVNGDVKVPLPGKEGIAVLATRMDLNHTYDKGNPLPGLE